MLSDEFFVKAAISGFILGLGFIFPIGPQNLKFIYAGATPAGPATTATTGYLSEIPVVWGGRPAGLLPQGLATLQTAQIIDETRIFTRS